MNIIEVKKVNKTFTRHQALTDVSLRVPRGSIYGLLGPNGAGKTTLIRIINHITAPDSGTVTFDGHPLTAGDVVHMGYLPEERGLYKKMKVGEQALFFARLKGMDTKQAKASLQEWFERMDITSWWDKKVEELSKGMAQKVQFIITVLHRPKLLIFDEPFSGFDPINAEVLKSEILSLRDQGATVIFSTHNMASVEELCNDITLINKSRNILSGNVETLRNSYGANRYTIHWHGDSETLRQAINPMITDFEPQAPGVNGAQGARVALKGADALPALIEAANRAVRLQSFNPYLPSMNEIFISAVKENGLDIPQE